MNWGEGSYDCPPSHDQEYVLGSIKQSDPEPWLAGGIQKWIHSACPDVFLWKCGSVQPLVFWGKHKVSTKGYRPASRRSFSCWRNHSQETGTMCISTEHIFGNTLRTLWQDPWLHWFIWSGPQDTSAWVYLLPGPLALNLALPGPYLALHLIQLDFINCFYFFTPAFFSFYLFWSLLLPWQGEGRCVTRSTWLWTWPGVIYQVARDTYLV